MEGTQEIVIECPEDEILLTLCDYEEAEMIANKILEIVKDNK